MGGKETLMDKLEKHIKKLTQKVNDFFKNDASGHNIGHLKRTMNYALYLQKREGGDREVVGVSAFIHDIHRILSTQKGRWVSPKESLPVVEEFVNDLDLSDAQKAHILHAIEHHEEYSFGKDKVAVDDIESKILQDADNLDTIGAIGIVRCFQYGFAHDMPTYTTEVPLYRNEFSEGKHDVSSIHHIYNKLLRLGSYMNTQTAKELAKEKTQFMEEFCKRFIDEFEGNF